MRLDSHNWMDLRRPLREHATRTMNEAHTERVCPAVGEELIGLFFGVVFASFRPKRQSSFMSSRNLVVLYVGPRFQKARASDRETLDREAFLQKVHGAVMLFHEVHAQLSEGAMFYSDLLQRLAQLNQTCEDLVRLLTVRFVVGALLTLPFVDVVGDDGVDALVARRCCCCVAVCGDFGMYLCSFFVCCLSESCPVSCTHTCDSHLLNQRKALQSRCALRIVLPCRIRCIQF